MSAPTTTTTSAPQASQMPQGAGSTGSQSVLPTRCAPKDVGNSTASFNVCFGKHSLISFEVFISFENRSSLV